MNIKLSVGTIKFSSSRLRNPVFKDGKELTDLYRTKSLLIELDTADSFVTAEKPLNYRLYRQLIAFSPDYGIKLLASDEKITLIRKDKTVWTVEADIDDFIFSGQLDFATNLKLIDKLYDY